MSYVPYVFFLVTVGIILAALAEVYPVKAKAVVKKVRAWVKARWLELRRWLNQNTGD